MSLLSFVRTSAASLPESRPISEDEEKVVAKKPYSAPTLVELDGGLTENTGGEVTDGPTHGASGP